MEIRELLSCTTPRRQALDGRRVLVIEKSLSQPDRIVGELLQPGGYIKLRELGMADCVEGIDSCKASLLFPCNVPMSAGIPPAPPPPVMCRLPSLQVYGYALMKKGKFSCVRYPVDDYAFDVAGRSFHHGRFVQKLRAKAASW